MKELLILLAESNVDYEKSGQEIYITTDQNGGRAIFLFDESGTKLLQVRHN